ncbi:HDOD domain-containing protein [Halioxenophilus sp. WMMB6]|uniref:HDOD domain-containing protein n=1 Tax=Halioxenophilus sp. WMMB6 TaxID=3073815 RepID=UPI00295F50E5|nr:HDOD domain-containing protein [Halioxenophilus sp. WMMB6]
MPGFGRAVQEEISAANLPSMPHILAELLRLCQDPAADFQHMARMVERDPVLSSQLISAANSAHFSRHGHVNSIERALLLMGTDALKTIAITASVQQLARYFSNVEASFLKSFWRRSLYGALIAKSLALMTSYSAPDEAYLLGLVHNLGELVLLVNYPEQYPHLLVDPKSNPEPMEQAQFHTTHSELSAYMVNEWGLGSLAADAVLYHHAALEEVCDSHHLTKIICLATQLAAEPISELHPIDPVCAEASERLFGMNAALTAQIAAKVTKEVVKIAGSLGIDLQTGNHTDLQRVNSTLGQRLQRQMLTPDGNALAEITLDTEEQSAETLSRTINLLFGYRNSLFLPYLPERNCLNFLVEGDSAGAIEVALTTSDSLVAKAARNRAIVCSADMANDGDTLKILDRQLMRLCDASSLVCLPVVEDDVLLGVIAMGDTRGTPPDEIKRSMLTDFAHQVASAQKHTLLNVEAASEQVDHLKAQVRAIVHEVNNPLAIVRNYLDALSAGGDMPQDSPQFQVLKEEVDRAAQILLRLQDLEAQSDSSSEMGLLNQEIRSLVAVLQGSICKTNGTECVLQLSPKLEKVKVPRNQLRQIVSNLVKNSVEAMTYGGKVMIATTYAGPALELIIADNGPGLPSEVSRSLFRPGITTKGKGHSGLGLSITRSLVDELKGTITCQSGKAGTKYRITLPAE